MRTVPSWQTRRIVSATSIATTTANHATIAVQTGNCTAGNCRPVSVRSRTSARMNHPNSSAHRRACSRTETIVESIGNVQQQAGCQWSWPARKGTIGTIGVNFAAKILKWSTPTVYTIDIGRMMNVLFIKL